jgi:hypothetical protein
VGTESHGSQWHEIAGVADLTTIKVQSSPAFFVHRRFRTKTVYAVFQKNSSLLGVLNNLELFYIKMEIVLHLKLNFS